MKLTNEIFENDFPYLDQYHNHVWIENSGIYDYDEIQNKILKTVMDRADEPHQAVFSDILVFLFGNLAIEVNPHDPFGVNIAGWTPDRAVKHFRTMGSVVTYWQRKLFTETEEGQELRPRRLELHETGALWSYPDTDHSKPYWEDIISLGIPGIIARLEIYRDKKTQDGVYTEDQRLYYESAVNTYKAIDGLLLRFAEAVKSKLHESDKMPDLYNALTHIAKAPPSTLYEVMLLTYIYHLLQEYIAAVQTRSLGHVDVLWRPFFENDLRQGTMTRDEIKTLLKYFYLRFEFAGHPNAQPFHIGGTNADGKDAVCDLTYTILEAYEELNIISPKIQIAISEKTPDEFIKKACDMIRNGHTSIVFANEDLGKKAMQCLSPDKEDLCDLSLSGCYNFSMKENVQPESVGTSFVKGVELALNNGIDPLTGKKIGTETGDAADFKDFDAFFDAYMKQTYHLIDAAMEVSDFFDKNMLEMSPSPMLSANFEHSVAAGKDVYYNGSKYHNTCITVSCIATATDSLYAVKKYVFDLGVITLSELRDILRDNWEGHEELRLTIANDKEKYGNDIDAVDSIAVRIMHETAEYILSHKTPLGQVYSPDGEGITHGIAFGKKTGATPDGRLALDQLSKNLQSVFGKDTSGITAYLRSVTKINAAEYPNGAPIDFVLHPTAVKGDRGLDVMLALIRTVFRNGGSAIQGNVYDADLLREAQKYPEKYKGLQVRLCGWSQYFSKLTKDEQDMMIRQAESAS